MGLSVDLDKAFGLYFQAAKAGHMASCYRTAMSCEIGIGTKRNPQTLHILVCCLIKLILRKAQLYEKPEDEVNGTIIQDEAYAIELYHKAAQLGYPASQFKLGFCYEKGYLGCTPDPRKSIAWYS